MTFRCGCCGASNLCGRNKPRPHLNRRKLPKALRKTIPRCITTLDCLYFELSEYEKSMANAKIAYDLGYNLPGLRDKLTKAGQWRQ